MTPRKPLFDPAAITVPEVEGSKDEKERMRREGHSKRIPPQIHRAPGVKPRRITAAEIKLTTIRALLGDIQPGEVVHLAGANHWSTHDLITVIAEQLRPCALWFATYSLSDPGVRRLAELKAAGTLTEIHAVINQWMARSRAPVTAQLLQIADQLSVYPVHAKAYVLRSATRGISIYSSANLTACAWLEHSAITDSKETADWTIGWIRKSIELVAPFTADKMAESVRRTVLDGARKKLTT